MYKFNSKYYYNYKYWNCINNKYYTNEEDSPE